MSLSPSVLLPICLHLAARKWNCLLEKKMNLFFPYLFSTTLRWCNIEERLPVVFKLLMKPMTTFCRKVWTERWIKWLMKTAPSSCLPAHFPLNSWLMLLITWAIVSHTHNVCCGNSSQVLRQKEAAQVTWLMVAPPPNHTHTHTDT